MTVDLARLKYLRKQVESGDATPEEHNEWLRTENTKEVEGLRESEVEICSALERRNAQAVIHLRDRVAGLAGAEMIEAGRRLWSTFKRRWGEEAAREAWRAVQPPRRQGRKEWQSIPPPRPRAYRTSDLAHFQRASKANRAALLATKPTQKDGPLSKEKAARTVLGQEGTDPARNFRSRKARPPIRD